MREGDLIRIEVLRDSSGAPCYGHGYRGKLAICIDAAAGDEQIEVLEPCPEDVHEPDWYWVPDTRPGKGDVGQVVAFDDLTDEELAVFAAWRLTHA